VTAWTRRQRPEGACESPSWLLPWASVQTPSASTKDGSAVGAGSDSGGLPAYEASAVDGCQSGAAHVDDFAIQVRVARACLTGQGEILYWQSRSRHLSYGAWQKSRIAAIERPAVPGGKAHVADRLALAVICSADGGSFAWPHGRCPVRSEGPAAPTSG
jgi:hypothetical protein